MGKVFLKRNGIGSVRVEYWPDNADLSRINFWITPEVKDDGKLEAIVLEHMAALEEKLTDFLEGEDNASRCTDRVVEG